MNPNVQMWTMWDDREETGCGRTTSAMVVYARNQLDAEKEFSVAFDVIPSNITSALKVNRSDVVTHLFSKKVLNQIDGTIAGSCKMVAKAQIHTNYA